VKISEEDYLEHYGILRKSGRYPWGSGENPYQRNSRFMGEVARLRSEGMSNTEIARGFGITTTELRAAMSIATNENRQADIAQAQRLKERGWSNVAIGERMGINESSVRSLLAPGAAEKAKVLDATADMLKRQVEEKGLIDVGAHVEHSLPGAPGTDQLIGVSRNKLDTAIAKLREQGYKLHYVKVKQLGTGEMTTVKVLSKPDVEYSEVFKNRDKIRQITEHSEDGGRSFLGLEPIQSVDSKRVKVNYAEDGGAKADGVIYVRPGVEDLSMGKSNYAQVRIDVDGTHFLKGMAIYNPDMPEGVDLVFNTNKSKRDVTSDKDAMKPLTGDPDNPFGAVISRQQGAMNILNEEGSWSDWSRSIASQMLSKQSPRLAKTQLELSQERRKGELDEILQLTNPAVRRTLLDAYAKSADSAAVHLKAAALPRQASHVIMPVNTLKSTEVYAPNYRDGERVVLIRYPHGGIFEIPELTVNNRQRDAKRLLGNAKDAIGINSRVAERLSGADFDGDTVLVIPNNRGDVKTAPALEGLRDFDPKTAYPGYEGMKKMTARQKQNEMGRVSNLITDMTIKKASSTEIAAAVRHSMVVIDAEKHGLNYKLSEEANGIAALKEKYQKEQGSPRAGASTLISRASSEARVPHRKPRPASEGGPIDPKTGKLVFVETGESYEVGGKTVKRTTPSTKAAEVDDAHTLSSGTVMEKLYADHSNRLKDLANTARREMVATKNTPYSPSAKRAYASEVQSLDAKLETALRNAPRERQAQIVANSIVRLKKEANPEMEPAEIKKVSSQALAEARVRTGADKTRVQITPNEWDAIQSGAISNHKLEEILRNTDLDAVKELATPKTRPTMTPARAARAQAMANAGYTQAEIADHLGVSTSTIADVLT
jgi:DNA-binding CsgD family transcriptional regulator